MSDKKKKEEEGEDKPKKGGGMMMKIIMALVLVGAGGGGVFGLMAVGVIGGGAEKEDNSPKLIRKGEEDPYAPVGGDGKDEGAPMVYGEGGSEYRTIYYTFSEDFTSNLRNSDALVQLTLAASTQRDGRVVMWMKEHELAIRSQLLIDLADTPEEDVFTPEGKQRLQKRMVASINRILTENEGFGGIDRIYFRSFIVQ